LPNNNINLNTEHNVKSKFQRHNDYMVPTQTCLHLLSDQYSHILVFLRGSIAVTGFFKEI